VEAALVEQRDPRVPYRALAQAETDFREQYPDALSVRAIWTPSNKACDVHVEVWTTDEEQHGLPCAEVYAWRS
jgi:hypothetical protein